MNNHIEVIENFLSKDECEFILFKYKNELKLSFAQTSIGIDKNRKSSVGWINELNGINERLTDLLKTSYDINGMEVTGLGPFQFTEYNDGDFFNWHKDVYEDKITEFDRYCSIVIQLNDEYENGNLEIQPTNDEIIILEKGMIAALLLLIFSQA